MKRILLAFAVLLGYALPAYSRPLHLAPVGPAFACKSIAHTEHCVVINVHGYEVATALTIPNTFVPNTTILSSAVNQNFSTIASWANGNVDNSNIGSGGIFLSQIKGATAARNTFGITSAAATLNVPLILGASAIADNSNVEVRNDNGGTNGLFENVPASSTNGIQLGVAGIAYIQMDSNGDLVFPTAAIGSNAPTKVALWNDSAATNGLVVNVPTGSSFGVSFETNAVIQARITAAGRIASVAGATTLGGIAPCFNLDGTDCASTAPTFHMLSFVANISNYGSCSAGADCIIVTSIITGANAQFANGLNGCQATPIGNVNHERQMTWSASAHTNPPVIAIDTTGRNNTNGALTGGGTQSGVYVTCWGT